MYIGIALIALAVGYKVFVDASKEKEGIKLLGQVIGIVVMIAALLLTACAGTKCLSKYKMGCPMMSKSACPMSQGSVPAN